MSAPFPIPPKQWPGMKYGNPAAPVLVEVHFNIQNQNNKNMMSIVRDFINNHRWQEDRVSYAFHPTAHFGIHMLLI